MSAGFFADFSAGSELAVDFLPFLDGAALGFFGFSGDASSVATIQSENAN